MKTLISEIASNCQWHKTVNDQYIDLCEDRIKKLQSMLPHGSGIDCGCKIDVDKSGDNKVIITFEYHHMNENGYYAGWTSHKLTVRPTFSGIDMKISGRDVDGLKEYLYDVFYHILNDVVVID